VIKILIVGKTGFIARSLIQKLKKETFDFALTSRHATPENRNTFQLDLTGMDHVPNEIIQEYSNIVFLAAESSPDVCQNDFSRAHSINVIGTSRFIDRCIGLGAKVMFFSSDTVYGNTGNLIVNEESEISPFGPYAEMKAELEALFAGTSLFKAVRMSYVVSLQDKFTSYLQSCSKRREEVEIFDPLIRSPITLNDVLDFIPKSFLQWDVSHKVNLCGPEVMGRLDIFNAYSRASKQTLKYNVSRPNNDFYKARPESIRMKSIYLSKILGCDATPVELGYMKELGEKS